MPQVRKRGSHRRVARIWSAAWLPLLLVGLVVVLQPVVDGFLLGFFLLIVAIAATVLRDFARKRRRTHRDRRSRGHRSKRGET